MKEDLIYFSNLVDYNDKLLKELREFPDLSIEGDIKNISNINHFYL